MYLGDTYRIEWYSAIRMDTVSLGYKSCDSCLSWIVNNIPNTGYYDWVVNVGNTINTQFKIYIIAYDTGYGSVTDVSDDYFTVYQTKPSPTPTVTPTPPPTPILNTAPIIKTSFIKIGRVDKNYTATITASDSDGDSINMDIYNLPPELSKGLCRNNFDDSGTAVLSCQIVGIPLSPGIYSPTIVVTDERRAMSYRTFYLIVY